MKNNIQEINQLVDFGVNSLIDKDYLLKGNSGDIVKRFQEIKSLCHVLEQGSYLEAYLKAERLDVAMRELLEIRYEYPDSRYWQGKAVKGCLISIGYEILERIGESLVKSN